MTHDFLLGGIILSPIVPEILVALVFTGLLSVALMRIGFYRLTWHRPLVEVAIFCLFLGGIVSATPDGWPIGGAARTDAVSP